MTRKSGLRHHIARELAQEILGSTRCEDYILATERELCRRFGASRVTVRLALDDVEHQGLIYRRHGEGTFARAQQTRTRADLVILGSPTVWKLRPLADSVAGMQAVLSPFRVALVLVGDLPSEAAAEAARTWGGMLAIRDDLPAREIPPRRAYPFPFLRLAESVLAAEGNDLFELGRRAAVMLNYAATTKTPVEQRQWEQYALQLKRNPAKSAGQPVRLSHLPADKIEAILRLVRKREAIETRLRLVEMRLAEIDSTAKASHKDESQPKTSSKPRTRDKNRAPMKDAVLAALKSAGPEGMKAKEIAERIGRNAGSVAVWLYANGPRIAGVSKPRPGRFVYRAPEDSIPQTLPDSGDTAIEEVKADAVPESPQPVLAESSEGNLPVGSEGETA